MPLYFTVGSINRRLPAELTATLAKSRYFLKPFGESRYLAMALYDLQIHDGYKWDGEGGVNQG